MRPIFLRARRGFPRLLTVLGLLAICLGSSSRSCSFGNSDDDDDDGDGGSGDEPSFVTQLRLQDVDGQITDTFERGELITMVLTVRNRLDTPAEVDFSTGRTSDFVVVRENTEDVVWQWSDDQPPFLESPATVEFEPNETKTFIVTWNQIGSNGVQVRSDTYEARGVLVYDGFDTNPLRSNQLGSTLERFTID